MKVEMAESYFPDKMGGLKQNPHSPYAKQNL